jgi:hypothetical protein
MRGYQEGECQEGYQRVSVYHKASLLKIKRSKRDLKPYRGRKKKEKKIGTERQQQRFKAAN